MSTPIWARLGSFTLAFAMTGAALMGLAMMRIDPLAPVEPAASMAIQVVQAPPPIVEPPTGTPPPRARASEPGVEIAVAAPVAEAIAPTVVIAEGAGEGGAIEPAPPVVRTAVPIGLPPRPNYPPRALARDKDGDVRVRLVIAPDGSVADVAVLSENPSGWGFGEAAVAALRRARFEPKRIDGAAVMGEFDYTVRFRLE